jgi:hypothetical protein
MGLAMQLVFTPMILRLMDIKRRAHEDFRVPQPA